MSASNESAPMSSSWLRVLLPLALGGLATWFLFQTQFDIIQFRQINWNWSTFSWIALAFCFLVFRHVCYMVRLRVLTGSVFSWLKTALFVLIWEFSTTIAPTSKGGPVVMFFCLLREGVAAGRATASMLYIAFLDTTFFVLSFPFWWSIFGSEVLMPGTASVGIKSFASGALYITFALMIAVSFGLATFLFFAPTLGQKMMEALARSPFLKRHADRLRRMGQDFVHSAAMLRSQPWTYHIKAILSTIGAWTSKFLMINCLILALYPSVVLDGSTQLFVYARLVSMYIIMTFSPSPGGAGLAEIALAGFISDIVPQSIGIIVAILWRMMAYYPYLILGAIAASWYFGKSRKV